MSKLNLILKLTVVAVVALALKYHYSTASVNELRWILAPTTLLVEFMTGIRFSFEPYAGYMSADNTFLIAASCSGVNFLLIAFLLLSLGPLWRKGDMEWRSLPAAIVIAYTATLMANTTRIVVAMWLQKVDSSIWGLTPDELHRIEGIVVYFGFLFLLFIAAEKVAARERLQRSSLVRVTLLPLGIYYAVTLGIPIVRGAFYEAAFWPHAILVIAIPAAVLLPSAFLYLAKSKILAV